MTTPLLVTFCVLLTATLAMALRRLLIIRFKGDECLHLLDADAPFVEQQRSSAQRLEAVDVWGKALTILTLVVGVATYVVWWFGA